MNSSALLLPTKDKSAGFPRASMLFFRRSRSSFAGKSGFLFRSSARMHPADLGAVWTIYHLNAYHLSCSSVTFIFVVQDTDFLLL